MDDTKSKAETTSDAREESTTPKKGVIEGSVELIPDNRDIDNAIQEIPEKRGSRQRKPVVLMQSQYDEIYATYHSRKKAKEIEAVEKEEAKKNIIEDPNSHRNHKKTKELDVIETVEAKKAPAEASSEMDVDEEGPTIEVHSRSSSRLAAKVDKKRKQDNFLFPETKKKARKILGETNSDSAQERTVTAFSKRPRRRDEESLEDEKVEKRPIKGSTADRGTPEFSLAISSQTLNSRGAAEKTTNEDKEGSQDVNESYSSYGENDDLTEEFPRNIRQFTKGPITEGSTTEGQIRVGPMYQASVPALCPKSEANSSRPENAVQVWKGGAIEDTALTSYLDSAVALLTYYLKKNRFYSPPTNTLLKILVPRKKEENVPERKLDGMPKELNVDAILTLLYEKSYDYTAALNVIEKSPEWFVNLWSKRDRDTYDTGFSKYYSNLRNIARGFGDSVSFKDIVDYHFRHKIPEQFRRYQELKLLQARRMLQAVESRRMQDTSNEKCDLNTAGNGSNTRIDNGNGVSMPATANPKKYHHW